MCGGKCRLEEMSEKKMCVVKLIPTVSNVSSILLGSLIISVEQQFPTFLVPETSAPIRNYCWMI